MTYFKIKIFLFFCCDRLDRKTKIQYYGTEFLEIVFLA